MKRFYLLLVVLMGVIMLPSVLGATPCFIDVTNFDPFYREVGKVSTQGHFTADLTSLFGYTLFCPGSWPFRSGGTSFTYAVHNSTVNGSGHVGTAGYTFGGEVQLGFRDSCVVRQGGCQLSESCIFKVNGSNNSHVADCGRNNFPMANDFDYSMCCQLVEICGNGIDDDEDGFIDCADSDCYGLPLGVTPPQECTGSPMNSTFCSGPQNATCIGQPPQNETRFYCSYGINDDPNNPPGTLGACCPAGTFSAQYLDPFSGFLVWGCFATEQCGIDPTDDCIYDLFDNETLYLSSYYQGDPNDWCHSVIPDLYSPGLTPDPRSTACCIIPKYGELGYYTDNNNVKIYG